MTTRSGDASREKILTAAEKLFAEHGFDKTTVDSIAAQAGINKALIYYHFDSKTEIIQTIYERILEEIENTGSKSVEDLHDQLMTELSGVGTFSQGMRIMLMEAWKTDGGSDALIQFGLATVELEHPELKNLPKSEYRKALTNEFFTGFISFLMFSMLKERWCKYTSSDLKDAEENFIKLFIENHINKR
jgi:AcrR family transcriptional regulator